MYFKALTNRSERSPGDIFFEFHSNVAREAISYLEMRQKIAASAAFFCAQGVAPGDVVLIFAQHGPGLLLSLLGAQWLGAVPALMPPPTSKQNLDAWIEAHGALIARLRPALVVASPECLDQVRALDDGAIVSTQAVERAPSVDDLTRPVELDDLDRIAFLQHSSGTTGLKKGVAVTYRQLFAQLDGYAERLGLDPETARVVSWLPLYHDMGLVAATLLPFYFALPVTVIETFAWLSDPGRFMTLLSGACDVYCWLPNFAFRHLARRVTLEAGSLDLSGVRGVINCSEPCKASDMQAFATRFADDGLAPSALRTCYAMAEYVFAVTQTARDEKPRILDVDADALERDQVASPTNGGSGRSRALVSVGRALKSVELRIGDGLTDGQVGEIALRGPSLCSGYYRNPALTATRFIDGWYLTGDLGFIDGSELFITGRGEDLIIVRGKNLYAHDIEAVIGDTPGVKPGRCVAFGVEDALAGTQILVLVAEIEDPARAAEVRREINGRVLDAAGVAPSAIVTTALDTLIKTTSGKISRRANRERYQRDGFRPPRPGPENALP